MNKAFLDLLHKYQAKALELGIEPSQLPLLAQYLVDLWQHNQEINLVSRRLTPAALVTDHLLDSLLALPHLPRVNRIADLGSGGGFPAIPLAICRPETRFLLFEKSPLKCKFLKAQCRHSENLEVRGPLVPEKPFPKVDLVTARGFKAIKDILRFTQDHYRHGGKYLLYKARRAKIDEELAAVPHIKAKLIPLKPIGDAQERHLVCF